MGHLLKAHRALSENQSENFLPRAECLLPLTDSPRNRGNRLPELTSSQKQNKFSTTTTYVNCFSTIILISTLKYILIINAD